MPYYKVKQGDYLSKIAAEFRIPDWKLIWNHPENSRLRVDKHGKSRSPNLIYEGETIFVPEPELRNHPAPSGQRYKFEMPSTKHDFHVQLLDAKGKPIVNEPYQLEIGKQEFHGHTDALGQILVHGVNARGSHKGTIILPGVSWFYQIAVGDLNPHSAGADQGVSGVKGRLLNQGYDPGPLDAQTDDQAISALWSFQRHALHIDPADIKYAWDDGACEKVADEYDTVKSDSPAPDPNAPEYHIDFQWTRDVQGRWAITEVKMDETTTVDWFKSEIGAHNPFFSGPSMSEAADLANMELLERPLPVRPNEVNKIKPNVRKLLYLDVGRWCNQKHNFALISGADVVLCEFGKPPAGPTSIHNRLIDHFLKKKRVANIGWEKIHEDQHPALDEIFIVIPDMHIAWIPPWHVEGKENQDQAFKLWRNPWGSGAIRTAAQRVDERYIRPQGPRDNLAAWDYFDSRSSHETTVQFLDLLLEIQDDLPDARITVVQIGDMYELWWNRRCYLKPNNDRAVDLAVQQEPELQTETAIAEVVGGWVADIHRVNHDIFSRFDRLKNTVFLHGNHDSYLQISDVVEQANAFLMPPDGAPMSKVHVRRTEYRVPGLLFQHGHLWDAFNRDGVTKGWQTCDRLAGWETKLYGSDPLVRQAADDLGALEPSPGMVVKSSGFIEPERRAAYVAGTVSEWLYDHKDFSVYVMGHTHEARLRYILPAHMFYKQIYVPMRDRDVLKSLVYDPGVEKAG